MWDLFYISVFFFLFCFVGVLSFLTKLKLSYMRDDVPLGDSQFRTLPTAILLTRLRLSRGSVNHKPIPNLAAGEMMFKTSPGHHTDRPLRTRVVTPQGAETGHKTTPIPLCKEHNVMSSKRAVCKTRITQISAQQLYPFALEPEHPKAF